MTNGFDVTVIQFCNQFIHEFPAFDSFVVFLRSTPLLKGGVVLGFFWWAWFCQGDERIECRKTLLATLVGTSLAMLVARLLASVLPFRSRPIYTEELHLVSPPGFDFSSLDGWSSFPSDHAALYFALASGIYLVSRRMGIFAFVYTALFIAFPRVYLGLHYPTDLLAGALIGIAAVRLLNSNPIKNFVTSPLLQQLRHHPGIAYAALFLITEQMATLFQDARSIGKMGLAILEGFR